MEKFLGVLCAGGQGTRLGKITDYIPKAFVPVYDRPAFMYPLSQLEASKFINEIVILTNKDNDGMFGEDLTYRTIIQDNTVNNMFSGLAYIRKVMGENLSTVLIPCDNISNIVVNKLINLYLVSRPKVNFAFSVKSIIEKQKLREMGVFNPDDRTIQYRPRYPKTHLGVLAPYIVSSELDLNGISNISQITRDHNIIRYTYNGVWFDIGTIQDLANAFAYLTKEENNCES